LDKIEKRHSLPFEIAPKNIKINNYIDQPSKHIRSSVRTQESNKLIESPFIKEGSATARFEKSSLKVNSIEDNDYLKTSISKNHFEKKRLSDNALNKENRYRLADDIIQESLFEDKKQVKKTHNNSVTASNHTA
jgi:hypothetical protein